MGAVLALCMGKYLRTQQSRTVILGGEAFPHMMPIKSEIRYFYENGCFDYYIQGYGEVPLLDLLRILEGEGRPALPQVGATDPLEKVNGLVYARPDTTLIENRPLFTRPEVVPDFEGLPMDSTTSSRRVGQPAHRGPGRGGDPGVAGEAQLLLPHELRLLHLLGRRLLQGDGHAADAMATAIKHLKERWQTPYFMFADDLFNISRRRAVEMAEAFVRHDLGIMWSDCAYGKHLKKEDLELFRASGACRLVWGMETGSRRIQDLIHKGIDLDEFAQIMAWSHEAGIYNSLEVVAGFPTETDEDIEETVKMLHALRPFVDQVYLNPFSLITGSLMHKEPEKYGITNVRPVATIFSRNPDEVYSWIQRYTFDEINGLPWKDKIKQIERSYRRVHEAQLELNLGGSRHPHHVPALRQVRPTSARSPTSRPAASSRAGTTSAATGSAATARSSPWCTGTSPASQSPIPR